MTPVKLVDASAVGALLFGEPEAEAVVERLADARLVAPSLLGFELTNVCPEKSRRHSEHRSSLTAAFRLRTRLAVEEIDVEHDSALELATRTGLTAYDAS